MNTFLWIIGSVVVVSLVSFIGVLTLLLKEKKLKQILLLLVGLSAGSMMGGAFFHILPEAISESQSHAPYFLVIAGFILFFLVEKVLHWHHCHNGVCELHSFGYMNLIGDGIHNFIDGLIIAATFLIDINLGIVTTVAIIFHEIPQEIGDFGVLIYSGFSKIKALMFNLLSAGMAILGGVIGYYFGYLDGLTSILLPFAAGGFIYISASDLLPEIKKEEKMSKFLPSFLFFILGLVLMYLLLFLEA